MLQKNLSQGDIDARAAGDQTPQILPRAMFTYIRVFGFLIQGMMEMDSFSRLDYYIYIYMYALGFCRASWVWEVRVELNPKP